MQFGHAMLADWPLDPDVTYLNHGTVGVTPLRVLAAQRAIRDEMEREPSQFLLREQSGLVGAPTGRPSRVRQAAAAVAAVRRRARRRPRLRRQRDRRRQRGAAIDPRSSRGDEILLTDHTYGAIARTAAFVARERGATVCTVARALSRLLRRRADRSRHARHHRRTRVAVFDHISAESALVFPVAELAAALPRARRRRARRWRACARRAAARRAVARRRLVLRESAQVGVRAAQLRLPVGARRIDRPASIRR